MYRNWFEVRAYMLDRQRELLRLAEAGRRVRKPSRLRRAVAALVLSLSRLRVAEKKP